MSNRPPQPTHAQKSPTVVGLTNFEIQKYYQNERRFKGVFSRNNLPKKINDGACAINLDEYADVGTHWIALFCNRNEIVYFDSFGV